MDRPDTKRLIELLAFAHGDLRDWPPRCGLCGNETIWMDYERDLYRCRCGALTTGEFAYRERVEAAAKELGVADRATALAIVQEWI